MQLVITVKRSAFLLVVLMALSTLAGLAGAELFARLWLEPPRYDRIPLDGIPGAFSADCYPRAAGAELPLDLGRDADAAEFSRRLPFMRSRSLASLAEDVRLREFAAGLPAERAVEILRERAPLCATYDMRPGSPRYLVAAPAPGGPTLALLGDSFVFGQGVAQEDAFTAKLARGLGARIVSYAESGADMAGIEGQFARALQDRRRLGFSKIVYVYVLNDPYRSPELDQRLDLINDLMNVRMSAARLSSNPFWRMIAAGSRRSALLRAIKYRLATRVIADRTLDWYRDLHDPVKNTGLLPTFERLRAMTLQARAEGLDFEVLVYPLMLDMRRYPLIEAHRSLVQLAGQSGVVLHDLLPAFQAHAAVSRLTVHPLDYHPNGIAQGIAADAAAAALRDR